MPARGEEGARAGRIHIGTSGWSYGHWVGRFYPAPARAKGESRLQQYARHFRSVEINATFYRLPSERAVRRWLAETPADFVFAAKMSRFVTHMKRLRDPEIHVPIFLGRLAPLAPKLGAVLVQLPPTFRADLPRLRAFVERLPPGRYAFEFRHPSWWSDATYALLAGHDHAFCLFDLAGRAAPEVVTAGFVYLRLHGPGEAYQGSYDAAALARWRDKIAVWRDRGHDVFVYFDNDEKAHAVANALSLQEMLAPLAAAR